MANETSISNESTLVDLLYNHLSKVTLFFYSVIFIFGTLGNGLVIYVTGFRMKKSVNSIWFLNLALADFLFTAFLIFMISSVSQDYHWRFGNIMCKLYNFVAVISMFASVFLLTAISLDRYLCIWVVVWAQNKRTEGKAQLICAGIWVLAIFCSCPYATFRQEIATPNKTHCGYSDDTPLKSLDTFRFVMGFLIPFLAICFSSVAIGVRAKRLQRARKRRCNRIIIAIILAFFICWLPFHVVVFVSSSLTAPTQATSKIIRIVGSLTVCLAFMNSCLNPILYVFMCDEFLQKLKQSICVVLESALAEDHTSFMSSRSLSSHLSRISRKSDSAAPPERKDTATSLNFTECKPVFTEERETLSSD